MGWYTNLLTHVAPQAALKRVQARRAVDMAKRSYEGASKGRRTRNWRAGNTSANAEISGAAATLRARSRDLVRNDGWAKRAVEIVAESAVGGGIIPKADTGEDRLDRQIDEAFEEWSEAADAEGQLDFYGLQDLAVNTIAESGDVLMRRRRRRAEDRLAVPMQIQLMEPDHLDATHLKNATTGFDIIQGIELDRLNRRAAYWLYPTHPGEVGLLRPMRFTSDRVPADQIAHGYRKTRPGQLTGVPWLSGAMIDLRDLADYEGAEAVRKKTEACFAGFVTRNDLIAGQAEIGEEDEDDAELEGFEPGMISYLEPGEDIKFAQPTAMSGYDTYTRSRLHKIATAAGMPYVLLTGDLSQVNWASYKAGIVPFKQGMRRFQKRTVLPMVCAPAWRWFIDSAFAAGRIDSLNYRARWFLPSFEPIDRQKELIADKLEARLGQASVDEQIRRSGRDPEKVRAEIVAWKDKTDAADLVFDSDPRKTSEAGLAQSAGPTEQPNTEE
ncbi:MAG: phage portal protein [Oceanicaulis sp.]